MRKILIIMGRYLPGYKDGGPVRSIKNLTDYLGDEYDFRILTCDRDHGDEKPYEGIKAYDWNQVGKASVYYVEPGHFTKDIIVRLADEVDLVYVCGCFNDYARNTLIENRLGRIKALVVVAAMGLFSPKEFHLKYAKKKCFVTVFNILGLFKNIYWSATSQMEIDEIRQQVWAKPEQFFIAEDLPRKVEDRELYKKKKRGSLDIVWLSRIAPKKNLKCAVEILENINDINVTFNIYGTVHNKEYWEECQTMLKKLPQNIKWIYHGEVESEKVVETLEKHQIFLFPTLGENYGHVIHEALSAGCPVIVSDETPWKDLEENNAGCVIPLEEKQAFVKVLEEYAKMDEETFNRFSKSARELAIRKASESVKNTGYRRIFELIR